MEMRGQIREIFTFKLGTWWLVRYMEERYSEDAQIFSVEVPQTEKVRSRLCQAVMSSMQAC